MNTIEKAIEAAGAAYALSRRIGISRQAVEQWAMSRVPAERVLELERATEGKVTRHELRPDIYPAEGV